MASARHLGFALALVAAACSTSSSSTTSIAPQRQDQQSATTTVTNQGGDLEGHTPMGFPGTGTGLFVGDNLNPSFPDGDGVQTYMTFALPEGLVVGAATLASNVLSVRGTPFDDLGSLIVEAVEYSDFGPQLFDLPATGSASSCRVSNETTVQCDVTDIVANAVDQGRTMVQFRLRFERIADNDGQADLAQFYRSDVNTNEPGLFELTITKGS
jgi:hypothetical protein